MFRVNAWIAPGLLLVGLLLPLQASAQMRICAYEIPKWMEDVQAIETALQANDIKEAKILVEVMDREWECLAEPVPTEAITRYMQLRAYLAFHSSDSEGAVRWSRAAQYSDPDQPWPAWVPDFHPIRNILEMEDETEVVKKDDEYLNVPKKGGVWIDGRWTTELVAPIEVPVFVQAYDKKGERLAVYWQEGAMFKPELVTDDPKAAAKAKVPTWYVPITTTPFTVAAVADTGEGTEEAVEDEMADEEMAAEEAPPEEEMAAEEPPPEEEAAVEEAPAEEVAADEAPAEDAAAEEAPEEPEIADDGPDDEATAEDATADAGTDSPAAASAAAAAATFAGLTAADRAAREGCPATAAPLALKKVVDAGWKAWTVNDQRRLGKEWSQAQEVTSCLGEVLDAKQAAAVHRLYAVRSMAQGDDDAALVGLSAAARLDPDWVVPDDLGDEGARLSELYAKAKEGAEVTTVDFATPDGATAFVDGAKASARPTGQPAIVQLQQDGTVAWSGWVTGDDALPDWMSAGTAESD